MSLTDTTGVEYVVDFLLLENLSKAVSANLDCTMNGQMKFVYYVSQNINEANYCVRN